MVTLDGNPKVSSTFGLRQGLSLAGSFSKSDVVVGQEASRDTPISLHHHAYKHVPLLQIFMRVLGIDLGSPCLEGMCFTE